QGQTSPGIGFSLSIEDLHSCLLSTDRLPQQAPSSDCLVIPTSTQVTATAVKYAHQLRQKDHQAKVELELSDRSETAIKQYAKNCRIKQLIWIESDGNPRVESLS
ncbi:MAG: ATP phosphoribosyltransferase regulatory subunit, partial [Cyanobacteria bacterium P01_A01_bin.135]